MSLIRITLKNFRSFKNYTIAIGDKNYLVGPNNAGKTTILTSLRLADIMIRYARSRKPSQRAVDNGLAVSTYPIPSTTSDFQSMLESVHYNFEETEARLQLDWKNGNSLVAVWPPSNSNDQPYFYLLTKKAGRMSQPVNAAGVIREFDRLGVIPILSPLDNKEQLLGEAYVKLSIDSRISSRHFRNNLYILKKEHKFDTFKALVKKWLPEIDLKDPELSLQLDNPGINIYYRENNQSTDKEIVWSGDGIQIWLQILFHVSRIDQSTSLILDEPEVYLHSDLQRRLLKLLESTKSQIILATHSTEIISNTESGTVTMIDRQYKKGIKIKSESMFGELTNLIGSGVDLRLVRGLRTKVIFFVEGTDMKLLDIISKKLELDNLQFENNITIIPLGGKSKHVNIEPFKWLADSLLSNSKVIHVLLDRDYQSDSEIQSLEKDLSDAGIKGHVWKQKELESYTIVAEPISRLTGISIQQATELITESTGKLKSEVIAQLTRSYADRLRKTRPSIDITSVVREASSEVEKNWDNIDYRLTVCPAKEIIKEINKILTAKGRKSIDSIKVAKEMHFNEVNDEMKRLLIAIDSDCN